MTQASAQELAHMLSDEEEGSSAEEGFWPPQSQQQANSRIFAVSGFVVLAATAMLGAARLQGGSAGEVMDDAATPLEAVATKATRALWPQWLPSGQIVAERALRNLKESSSNSHLTQECVDVMLRVREDVMNATARVVEACRPDPEAEACLRAARQQAMAAEKMAKLISGQCDEAGYMLCNISQVEGEVRQSAPGCVPPICKPRNVLLDSLEAVSQSRRIVGLASCKNCSLEISCVGHDVVTEAMVKEQFCEDKPDTPGCKQALIGQLQEDTEEIEKEVKEEREEEEEEEEEERSGEKEE